MCSELSQTTRFSAIGRSGTFGYQAPEVLMRSRYGWTADFYSLGVTLYNMLTNKMPFSLRSPDSVKSPRDLDIAKVHFHGFSFSDTTRSFLLSVRIVK